MGDYVPTTSAESGGTLGMRVAAGVFLFFASASGVVPPLLKGPSSAELEHGRAACRMKAFAAGVMLGLAIMHVIADSFADMADLMVRRRALQLPSVSRTASCCLLNGGGPATTLSVWSLFSAESECPPMRSKQETAQAINYPAAVAGLPHRWRLRNRRPPFHVLR